MGYNGLLFPLRAFPLLWGKVCGLVVASQRSPCTYMYNEVLTDWDSLYQRQYEEWGPKES